ncbi:aldehyde dehydrogenase [Marinobacterium zhoushanense]|uniref:Aldehyde dehydrogenase n=1 Tax=Marinobacterium zhoushanense TaxID=1679163 RepID=A0ABQ1K0E1_9GAMM|nr:aldehyde dehydrogenase family protein [Marinobacterium zhoushanense]GGB80083.1 aldehyde dehydrogenase [Marinobacterium zhoushanense]
MNHYPMTINGEAVDSSDRLEVINPATGQVFATCALANEAHVQQAVAAAKTAFKTWGVRPDSERKALIHQVAACIEENSEELIKLITLETGKPVAGLGGVGATMEVMGSAGWSHVTADIDLAEEVIQDDETAYVAVTRKPLGVVASVTPWNWPLLIAIWHVISAIRVGNTVVIKPSENTPLATARFVELANTVLPPGVLNIVVGRGDVGQALASSDSVQKIVFTGSTHTGKRIMASAAASLKRMVLELGGNDAAIVLPDADLDKLAAEIFAAAFHNNGQTCACLKRLYVHESLYDDLCRRLAVLAKQVKVGNGFEDGTELGPLQNEAQLKVVEDLVARSREEGGQILAGGERLPGDGFFFQPTIVAGLSNGNALVDSEQFGPVLPVIQYATVDEAVRMANDSPNGLGGSVWGSDVGAAESVARQLECGTVWINGHGGIQPDAPFGGIKESGFGVEFGRYGLEECTSIQTLKIHRG